MPKFELSHYEVLGTTPTATVEEIKAAYDLKVEQANKVELPALSEVSPKVSPRQSLGENDNIIRRASLNRASGSSVGRDSFRDTLQQGAAKLGDLAKASPNAPPSPLGRGSSLGRIYNGLSSNDLGAPLTALERYERAWEVLSDDEKRKAYDEELMSAARAAAMARAPGRTLESQSDVFETIA